MGDSRGSEDWDVEERWVSKVGTRVRHGVEILRLKRIGWLWDDAGSWF